MKIVETSLRRPVSTIILAIATIYFGLYSYSHMGVEQTPDVDLPIVMVTTTMDGATAKVMDNDVTDVLEEQINTISGIDSLSSSSYMGTAVTVVEFEIERDIDAAAADVRDKVNAARDDLPDEVDEPIIAKYDIGDTPMVLMMLTGPAPYKDKVYFADKILKIKMQSASGVGNVELPGMRDREIRIWIDPVRLRSRNLLVSDVKDAIAAKHVELPAGGINIDRYKMDLRVEGEYATVEELASLPITTRDGVVIRLGEVADVEDGFEEQEDDANYNGESAIMVTVKKQRGANEVAVCDAAVAKYNEVLSIVPEGMKLEIIYNKADFIRRSMRGVSTDVIQAVVLCSLLMLFFLQTFRATFVTVISMPTSLIGSFCVLSYLGITINNMSMMGISLAVGMVVDATTVVLENIYNHMKAGEKPFEAALNGTNEVAFSILGGSFTTIGVFFPVATMGGVIGRFFYAFGITVVVTIAISLIVSITVAPFACSRILRVTPPGRIAKFCDGLIESLVKGYRRLLTAAVYHKTVTLAIAFGIFILGVIVAGKVGSTFTTDDDDGMIMINCEFASGTEIEETSRVMNSISSIVRENPYVLRTSFEAGTGRGNQSNKGTIYVQLIPRSGRPEFQEVRAQLRTALQGFRDVKMDYTMSGGKDVQMVLSGAETETLIDIANKMIADMEAQGRMRDINVDVRLDKPQINVKIDRGMSDAMNVDVNSISTEIQAYFAGVKAGVFKEGGYRYDIRLMARRDQRSSLDDLRLLPFRNANGDIIQAPGVIQIEQVMAPSVVKRYDRQTSLTVSANVNDDYSSGEGIQFMYELGEKHIPKDSAITIQPTARTKKQPQEFARLKDALFIAISLVYIILAIQFESFLHPLTVMFSLPLMLPGAFFMMYAMGVKFDVMAYMGVILLVGVVVNNAIILVDVINQNRLAGMDKVAAVINAGPRRLRAILITSLSTLIGAIPAAMKWSEGSESRQPMSVVTFGGLFASTLLTLLVIPVVYIVFDNIKEWLGHKLFQKALP